MTIVEGENSVKSTPVFTDWEDFNKVNQSLEINNKEYKS